MMTSMTATPLMRRQLMKSRNHVEHASLKSYVVISVEGHAAKEELRVEDAESVFSDLWQ